MKQPGFMIYAEEWSTYAEDFSDEELGRMLRALLSYFNTQEQTDFADRGMRQFFRQAAKSIDLDAERYALKCRQNAYNRYKGACRQQNKTPLDFEQWLTNVDDRQGPSPISIPTSITNINSQYSKTNSQPSTSTPTYNPRAESGADFGAGGYRPLSEDEFEKKRERAIAALSAIGRGI